MLSLFFAITKPLQRIFSLNSIHHQIQKNTLLYQYSRPLNPFNLQIRTFKVKPSIRRRCPHCYIVKRRGTLYVRCKMHPRHKQRQG